MALIAKDFITLKQITTKNGNSIVCNWLTRRSTTTGASRSGHGFLLAACTTGKQTGFIFEYFANTNPAVKVKWWLFIFLGVPLDTNFPTQQHGAKIQEIGTLER